MIKVKENNIKIIFYSLIISLIVLFSFIPDIISGYSPFSFDESGLNAPNKDHYLGTDFLGRDVLSRTLAGARISLLIGVVARTGSLLAGLAIGLVAGFSIRLRSLLGGITDVFLAIPSLLLAMGLAVVLDEGYAAVSIAIIAGTWAPAARFVTVKISEINSRDYIMSAHVIGASSFRIVMYYILPALLPSLIPLVTTGMAASIMMESTLSFLGLAGSSSVNSMPSWGIMIQEGARFLFDAPWIIIPPSVVLSLLILSFNRIGDILTEE